MADGPAEKKRQDGLEPLALYVHWPFCLSKCPYCDFNSHVRDGVDQNRWRDALVRELDRTADETGPRRLTSIFFGGGTPSLMPAATAAAVIERAADRWSPDPDIEITLEANPTSVEAARLRDFHAAGVNRVSLGVQALDDDSLRFLGRHHSAAEALDAVETARGIFPRHSFDLIYARPDQSVAAWRAELKRALDYVGDHLSVYQLTIERGTPFHAAFRRGELSPPDEETGAALYEATQEALEEAGLGAYEISNHARQGAESRHNLAYWRYEDYAGIGPGAHGRITLSDGPTGTERLRLPEVWLEAVERDGDGMRARTPLSPGERRDELMLMGLRLTEGVRRDRVHRRLGREIEDLLDPARLARMQEAGFAVLDKDGLRATAEGRQRLNAVIDYLLATDGKSDVGTPGPAIGAG